MTAVEALLTGPLVVYLRTKGVFCFILLAAFFMCMHTFFDSAVCGTFIVLIKKNSIEHLPQVTRGKRRLA